jgi:hypothetical protein
MQLSQLSQNVLSFDIKINHRESFCNTCFGFGAAQQQKSSSSPVQNQVIPTENDERYYLIQLEALLAETGLDCSIFTPSKVSKDAKERRALMRRKRGANLISCEVRGFGKLKVFRFNASDVIGIIKGKGSTNCVVPSEIEDHLCMTLTIIDKGELTVVLESERLLDAVVLGLSELVEKCSQNFGRKAGSSGTTASGGGWSGV